MPKPDVDHISGLSPAIAIEQKNWSKACIAMLDYYDRCYDYELKKYHSLNKVDISGLNLELSLIKISDEKLDPL